MPLFDILTQVNGKQILWAAIEAGNTIHAREIIKARMREDYKEPNGDSYVKSVMPTKRRDGK